MYMMERALIYRLIKNYPRLMGPPKLIIRAVLVFNLVNVNMIELRELSCCHNLMASVTL